MTRNPTSVRNPVTFQSNVPDDTTGDFALASEPPSWRLGVVCEAFHDRSLEDLAEFLARNVPAVTELEVGSGGYAPSPHCDVGLLLDSGHERAAWTRRLRDRGLRVAALNAWGNPLHPDDSVAAAHDRALRDSLRLAGLLGVDRVVALAGCPGASPADAVPHFAAGGWLPYLADVYERQWPVAESYWSSISDQARRENPNLRVCVELHPGTLVYNLETFERFAGLGNNLAANVDPSHFFWMQMDTFAVCAELGEWIGHAHAKDVKFRPDRLAVNGILDHRWPSDPQELPWTFATVGQGHDEAWWRRFAGGLGGGPVTIAIEHEDPFVPAEQGIVTAARILMPESSPPAGEYQ